jgi:hypothetical protein
MHSTVFWDVTPCSLEEGHQHLRALLAASFLDLLFDPEDWGITFLWNISELLPDYTVLPPEDSALHSHQYEDHNSNNVKVTQIMPVVQQQLCNNNS